MKTTGILYLLPNVLCDDSNPLEVLPTSTIALFSKIDGAFVENEKEARKLLTKVPLKKPIQQIPLVLVDEKDHKSNKELFEPLFQGESWGVLSDAGLPGIADPGSNFVAYAHKAGITVQAGIGPSSIIMALQLSGFYGQPFTFFGYLPKKQAERIDCLKRLEKRSRQEQTTFIFIETPYRNQEILKDLVNELSPETKLCVATELTSPKQSVLSMTVNNWRKIHLPDIYKKQAVFLFSV